MFSAPSKSRKQASRVQCSYERSELEKAGRVSYRAHVDYGGNSYIVISGDLIFTTALCYIGRIVVERTQHPGRSLGTYLTQQEFFVKTFQLMSLGLFITAVVAYYLAMDVANMSALFNTFETTKDKGEAVTSFTASGWWWGAAIGQLAMVLVISGRASIANMNATTGLFLFATFAALNGITIAPMLYAYTAASVAKVFLITSITFTGCALWGMTTKRDLTGMGTFFLYALIGLLVTMIVNAFFGSPTTDYLISFAAILLFAAITAFDMQKLRQMHRERMNHNGLVVYGALTLYLDFINLFIHLLRFFGVKKD